MSIINSAVLTHLNPSKFISFIHTEIFVIFEVLGFQCNYGLAHPQTGSQELCWSRMFFSSYDSQKYFVKMSFALGFTQ